MWALFPHTHLRGKKWDYKLILPDGDDEDDPVGAELRLQLADLLHVQGAAAGAEGREDRLDRVVRQLAGNKSNPDPKADVKWGDQTWEEMQYTGILFSPVQAPAPGSAQPARER